jgi:hypothetical protein
VKKGRIIGLLAFALSFSLLTVPVQHAQAEIALGNTWVSNSGPTNFYFSETVVNKSNFLAQSESVTVTGILRSETTGTPAAVVGAIVTLGFQKVDPTNANANVGAPETVTAITGANGIFSESITAPLAGKYFITMSVDDGVSERTVKINNADNSAFFIYSFNGGPGVAITAPISLEFGAAANLGIQLTVFGGAVLANETVTVLVWNTEHPTETASADFISDLIGITNFEVVSPYRNCTGIICAIAC